MTWFRIDPRLLARTLLLLLVVSACDRPSARPSTSARSASVESAPSASGTPPSESAPPAKSAPPLANEVFTGTVGIVDVKRERAPSILLAVRAATHAGYDRVVFEFRGGVPGYHLEYVDRPVRDCGAGDPRPIAGDAWLEVRLSPAHAHEENGRPTVPERELRPQLPNVLEIERTCDFEAVVTWVLGVASPKRYRVLELTEPPRLVVDVAH
ncbi:MAG TPA: hypothetical protein VFZ53_07300 [Polyangiaceae bacterium]